MPGIYASGIPENLTHLQKQPFIYKIGVLVNFAKITGNTCARVSFLISCRPETFYPVDTVCKLNVHKKFRRRPGGLLNILCTFN